MIEVKLPQQTLLSGMCAQKYKKSRDSTILYKDGGLMS